MLIVKLVTTDAEALKLIEELLDGFFKARPMHLAYNPQKGLKKPRHRPLGDPEIGLEIKKLSPESMEKAIDFVDKLRDSAIAAEYKEASGGKRDMGD